MYGIVIEEGIKHKCPHCNAIFAIENGKQTLYRNITLLFSDKETGEIKVKCKQCKNIIKK